MLQLSIIIPTKNEEKFLPKLLKSLEKQNDFNNCEIIVADNSSHDGTREIAKWYHATIVHGGIPSVARNNGAKIAKWKWLVFLDADMILMENSLKKWIEYLEENWWKIWTPYIELEWGENNFLAKNYYSGSKFWYHISDCTFWWCLIVEKELFFQIWWFDEDMILLEDVDFVVRGKKFAKRMILKPEAYTSARRFEKVGSWKLIVISTWIFFLYKIWGKKFLNFYNKVYKL